MRPSAMQDDPSLQLDGLEPPGVAVKAVYCATPELFGASVNFPGVSPETGG